MYGDYMKEISLKITKEDIEKYMKNKKRRKLKCLKEKNYQ